MIFLRFDRLRINTRRLIVVSLGCVSLYVTLFAKPGITDKSKMHSRECIERRLFSTSVGNAFQRAVIILECVGNVRQRVELIANFRSFSLSRNKK